MEREQLKQNFEKVANEYLRLFCRKHDLDYKTAYWIADDVGSVCCINEYYFVDFAIIKTDIDYNADKEAFFEWYDYTTRLTALGTLTTPNYRSWLLGCPRKSETEIQRLEALYNELQKSLNEQECENYINN